MSDAPEELAYEEFEHSADVGLRVRGRSLRELFQNAGRGMAELMLDTERVKPRATREVQVEGDDVEMLLVAWLSEILFAFDADRFAPATVEVESLSETDVKGLIRGEPFKEWRHEVRNVIKAVTYHNLKIEKSGGEYRVEIIFDV